MDWSHCGLLVDYCDVFISSLDSHSDGIHSLQRTKWCNAKFSPISPNLLHLSTLSKFIFGWNIYLTDSVNCDKGRYFGIEHIFRAAGFWFLVRGWDTLYLSYFPAVPRQLTFYFCQQWAIQVCRACSLYHREANFVLDKKHLLYRLLRLLV